MICPKCGNNCADNTRFCTRCGSPLSGSGGTGNSSNGGATEAYGGGSYGGATEAYGGGSYGGAAGPYGYGGTANSYGYGYGRGGQRQRQGLPTAVWIAMALAVVAVCAAVIFVFVLRPGAAAIPARAAVPTAAPAVPSAVVPTVAPAAPSAVVPTVAPAVPTAIPSGPNPSDLGGSKEVEEPRAGSWLPDYNKTRYVLAPAGVSIYLVPEPRKSGHIDTVNDDVKVTVLAEQDGYSFIRTSDGRVGWVNGDCLVTDSERISRIPDLDYTYWWYHDGTDIYQCKIVGKKLYAYNVNTCIYSEEKITTIGRRLKVFGVHFVWNGTYFTGSSGKYLERDPEEMYDFVCISPNEDDYPEYEYVSVWNQMDGEITAYEVIDGEEYIWVTDCNGGDEYCFMIDSSCVVYDRYAYTETYRYEDMLVNTYDTVQPLIDLYGLPLRVGLQIHPDNYIDLVMSVEKSYIGS